MKEKKLLLVLLGLSYLYGAYAFYALIVGLTAQASSFFKGALPFWPGYLHYLSATFVPFALYRLAFAENEKERVFAYKYWGFAVVLLSFAAIAGIGIETSLGALSWTTHGLSSLYPVGTFVMSFVFLFLGFLGYTYGDRLAKRPSDFPYAEETKDKLRWLKRLAFVLFALIALYDLGSLMRLPNSFDPSSSHLGWLFPFYFYMLQPSVFLAYLVYGYRLSLSEKREHSSQIAFIVFLSVGVILFILRVAALLADPLYLAEGGTPLLVVDFSSRISFMPVFLFLMNVLVPCTFLLSKTVHKARLHTIA
jgi:hypothetical protein